MKEDTQKDRRMARIVLSGSVAMLPLIAGAGLLAGNDLVVAALMSALFSAIGALHLWRPSVFPRAILGIGLTGQAISLTAALTGHPWQIDAHMTFFALLATLIALMDVPTIVAATLVIAVHHLSLTFALPALVYPSLSLGLNIQRTIFHAVVVLVESGALILTIRRLKALDAQNSRNMETAEAASRTAEQARDAALTAKTEADRQRQAAELASRQTETALRELEERQAQAETANREARSRAEADLRDADTRRKVQEDVVATMGKGMKALADGNLTLRLEDVLPPEYDGLRADYNSAAQALSEAIADVAFGATAMMNDASHISQTTDDLSRRAEHLAHKLAEATTAMRQITDFVKASADGAAEAMRTASDVRSQAEDGSRIVARTSAAMAGIDNSASEINTIIDVIEQIAFQTNLLALNAGVEAARAGEAGRGFAVVASEVRSLAQRSSEAARDISNLISKSQSQVKDGVRLVGETVEALEAMSTGITAITAKIEEISKAASDQSEALSEVSSSVSAIDSTTQDNSAKLEETAAAANQLTNGMRDLAGLTDRFRYVRSDGETRPGADASHRTVARLGS